MALAIREIFEIPDLRLRVNYTPVSDVSLVQNLITDLLDTLYSTDNGIGLAAPQIGHSDAVIVIDLSEDWNNPLIMINPEIIESYGELLSQEGCLSVPGISAEVKRSQYIKIRALDRDGNEFYIEQDDYLAIVIQHEIDHLHGRIFINYLSPLKREQAMKKITKWRKQEQRLVQ